MQELKTRSDIWVTTLEEIAARLQSGSLQVKIYDTSATPTHMSDCTVGCMDALSALQFDCLLSMPHVLDRPGMVTIPW